MCGITGIFDTRGTRAVHVPSLQRMNDSQHHRGPDEGSVHVEPGVGFGHRRLSIIDIDIDIDTGQQPLFSEDDTHFILPCGKIFSDQWLARVTAQPVSHQGRLGFLRAISDSSIRAGADPTWQGVRFVAVACVSI